MRYTGNILYVYEYRLNYMLERRQSYILYKTFAFLPLGDHVLSL
jgi:hypothetical protein